MSLLTQYGKPYGSKPAIKLAHPTLKKMFSKHMKLFGSLALEEGPAQNPFGYRKIDERAVALTKVILEDCSVLPKRMAEVADSVDVSSTKIHRYSAMGPLRTVAVSLFPYLDWGEPLNEDELKNSYNKPDRLISTMQGYAVAITYVDEKVKTIMVVPQEAMKQGGFACDWGAAFGEMFVKSRFKKDERKPEEQLIKGGVEIPEGLTFEGGDGLVCRAGAFIGASQRTDLEAARWIAERVNGMPAYTVRINKNSLHEDISCIFGDSINGNPAAALLYYPGIHKGDWGKINHAFGGNVHRLSKEAKDLLHANVVFIDSNRAMVGSDNSQVAWLLKNVFRIKKLIRRPLSAASGSGGAHHCYTLELERD